MAQANAWVSFLMRLPIPPGLREVRLSVEQDDDRGTVFGSAILPASAGFSASDIVLGSGEGSIPWRRNAGTVEVSPFSFYTVGESVPLYYELYGLTSGAEYRTVLSLRKEGDRKVASSVSFRDVPTGTQLDANRTLTLTDIKPGQYKLIVTVRGSVDRARGRAATDHHGGASLALDTRRPGNETPVHEYPVVVLLLYQRRRGSSCVRFR